MPAHRSVPGCTSIPTLACIIMTLPGPLIVQRKPGTHLRYPAGAPASLLFEWGRQYSRYLLVDYHVTNGYAADITSMWPMMDWTRIHYLSTVRIRYPSFTHGRHDYESFWTAKDITQTCGRLKYVLHVLTSAMPAYCCAYESSSTISTDTDALPTATPPSTPTDVAVPTDTVIVLGAVSLLGSP